MGAALYLLSHTHGDISRIKYDGIPWIMVILFLLRIDMSLTGWPITVLSVDLNFLLPS